MTTPGTVIIGAGHAAGQLILSLRQHQYDQQVTLIGEEPHLPYQRPPLSKKFLAGALAAERLYLKPPAFYEHAATTVLLGCRTERIDLDRRLVLNADGSHIAFDKLVFATGASPRRLVLPGSGLTGVHYLRSIGDVEAIRGEMQKGARLVIIGGGYIGLEVAAVASSLGLQVTVVESSERVMSRVVSQHTSDFFAAKHRQHGVRLVLGATLSRFSGNDRVRMVELADRSTIPADLVLVCIGVQPNTELAERAGLEVSNGIAVDLQCRTGVEGVFAVGDCTNHPNPILGRRLRLESVHNALEQAKTAASTICGLPAEYAQVPWFWSDQYELKLQIAGISEGHDRTVLRGNPEDVSHACLYLRDGQLIAVDAINAPKDFMQSKALIADHATVSPDTLANPDIALKDMI